MIKPIDKLEYIYKETEELIAIVAKSITTAQKNKKITEWCCNLKIEHWKLIIEHLLVFA